jgi:hypothetical protein
VDKSNFNKHVKLKHSDPDKLKIELGGVRGSLRRHKGRMSSKNETVRAESTEAYEAACNMEEIIKDALRRMSGKGSKKRAKKSARLPTGMLEGIKKAFADKTESMQIVLTKDMIQSVEKTGEDMKLVLKDPYEIPEDEEEITYIELEKQDLGWEVRLMQTTKDEKRGLTFETEYDSSFIYL